MGFLNDHLPVHRLDEADHLPVHRLDEADHLPVYLLDEALRRLRCMSAKLEYVTIVLGFLGIMSYMIWTACMFLSCKSPVHVSESILIGLFVNIVINEMLLSFMMRMKERHLGFTNYISQQLHLRPNDRNVDQEDIDMILENIELCLCGH